MLDFPQGSESHGIDMELVRGGSVEKANSPGGAPIVAHEVSSGNARIAASIPVGHSTWYLPRKPDGSQDGMGTLPLMRRPLLRIGETAP